MQAYSATRVDSDEKIVLVRSKLCQYKITVEEGLVFLEGPGVDEEADMADLYFDNLEDAAIYYVLLFENGLWPED